METAGEAGEANEVSGPEAPVLEAWPALPFGAWQGTRDTLHMWTQIVGKIRMALAPPINHWWHVTLHPTARGLTTLPLPWGEREIELSFDFYAHELAVQMSDGRRAIVALGPRSVADFYRTLMDTLAGFGVEVAIWPVPVEVPNPIPFAEDEQHAAYDPVMVNRFFLALGEAHRLLDRFRSGFVGKCSPTHFFWGGFDLAVTRFSGRPAPEHPPVPGVPDSIVREAYSHEVVSCGFWPGDERFPAAAFYAYAYPEPAGFRSAPMPTGTSYNEMLGELVLPYDSVREDPRRDELVDAFTASAYEAAARLGGWDRPNLERPPTPPRKPPRASLETGAPAHRLGAAR